MALRVLYTIFLALLLATFVGLGIAAFYPGPKFLHFHISNVGAVVPKELVSVKNN